MKRIISIAAAVAMIFGAASCQKELATQKGDCKVSFSVSIPDDLATKAEMSDGSTVDELVWEVYSDASNDPVYEGSITEYTINSSGKKQFVLELNLVTNVKYDLLFWAQKKDTGHYNTHDLRNVWTNYNTYDGNTNSWVPTKANDETRDAFYGSRLGFETSGIATNETVELRRPFAQINFGTLQEDWDNAQPFISGVGLKSKFVFKSVPNTFNVKNGNASGSMDVIFDYSLCPASEDTYTNNHIIYSHVKYAWIGMNYIFASNDRNTINEVTGSFVHKGNTEASALTKYVPNVPFRQNYKTNILGQIFTGGNTFNVIIEPGFNIPGSYEEPEYNIVDPIEKVVANGGTYVLTGDMEISKSFTIGRDKKVVINLNGYTLKYTGEDILFRCADAGYLKVTGNGTIEANGYIASGNGGRIVVENGTFVTSDATLFQSNGGELIINGGSFKAEPYNGKYYTINMVDGANGKITVNAGRFYKFNPALPMTELDETVSFIPGDRKVTVDGDWYVVSYIHD